MEKQPSSVSLLTSNSLSTIPTTPTDDNLSSSHSLQPPKPTISQRIQDFRRSPNTAVAVVTFAFYVDYVMLLACVPLLPLFGKNFGLSELGNHPNQYERSRDPSCITPTTFTLIQIDYRVKSL